MAGVGDAVHKSGLRYRELVSIVSGELVGRAGLDDYLTCRGIRYHFIARADLPTIVGYLKMEERPVVADDAGDGVVPVDSALYGDLGTVSRSISAHKIKFAGSEEHQKLCEAKEIRDFV